MALENKTAPSGIIYTDFLFRIIEQLGRARSVVWNDEPFVLKSKRLSHVYVNCRNDLTENPRLLHDLGYLIAWKARSLANDAGDRREVCLIGIPTAGTALALAGSLETRGSPRILSRIMREKLKDHGAHNTWVNGTPNEKLHSYMSVDNVITDGASKRETIVRLAQDGYSVDDMPHLILVDRQQGGVENLRKDGINVQPILYLLDLAWAFGELGFWPKERVKAVEDEIAAHQIS